MKGIEKRLEGARDCARANRMESERETVSINQYDENMMNQLVISAPPGRPSEGAKFASLAGFVALLRLIGGRPRWRATGATYNRHAVDHQLVVSETPGAKRVGQLSGTDTWWGAHLAGQTRSSLDQAHWVTTKSSLVAPCSRISVRLCESPKSIGG